MWIGNAVAILVQSFGRKGRVELVEKPVLSETDDRAGRIEQDLDPNVDPGVGMRKRRTRLQRGKGRRKGNEQNAGPVTGPN